MSLLLLINSSPLVDLAPLPFSLCLSFSRHTSLSLSFLLSRSLPPNPDPSTLNPHVLWPDTQVLSSVWHIYIYIHIYVYIYINVYNIYICIYIYMNVYIPIITT